MSSTQEPTRRVPINTPYGTFLEVSLSHFRKHVLPPLHHGTNHTHILQVMKDSDSMEETNKPPTTQDPMDSAHSQETSFTSLKTLANAIIKTTSVGDQAITPTVYYQSNARRVFSYPSRDETTLPDAYMACVNSPEPSWASVAVCGEHNKGGRLRDVKENMAKVTSSMSLCMRKDPRRRFVFGYTIVDSNMRFWYWDRAQSLVSRSFDFVKERENVIHFFLAIMYAEPHELGWDPTMVPSEDNCHYDITVHCEGSQKVYRTLELLSDYGAQDVHSKGTRVWKAIAIVDGKESGKPVALKDCWVESMLTPEGKLCELVRADAQASDLYEFLDVTFLTVCCHGRVFLDSDRKVLDCASSSSSRLPSSNTSIIHYRIVFKQIGQPISHQTSLKTIFNGLARVAGALCLMHAGKWVHRDVSTRNILLDLEGGEPECRLADLEYAKPLGLDVRDDRLGTSFFMAVEVDFHRYLFADFRSNAMPNIQHKPNSHTHPVWDTLFGKVPPTQTNRTELDDIPVPRVFRYNPLHDLESLWWVAVYFLFKREIVAPAEPSSSSRPVHFWDPQAQRDYADQLFNDRGARYVALRGGDDMYGRNIGVLHPSIQPLAAVLDRLRLHMMEYYAKAEDYRSPPDNCADGLHEEFAESFLQIVHMIGTEDIHVQRRSLLDRQTAPSNRIPNIKCADDPNPAAAQSVPQRRPIEEVEDTAHNVASVAHDGAPSKKARLSTQPRVSKPNAAPHRPTRL